MKKVTFFLKNAEFGTREFIFMVADPFMKIQFFTKSSPKLKIVIAAPFKDIELITVTLERNTLFIFGDSS